MVNQLDATNKALVSVKESLKENSKKTIDYISEINKAVKEDKDISEFKHPHLENLTSCLTELS